jgi:pimeloyl-ACP methyl ester carboxylesterase
MGFLLLLSALVLVGCNAGNIKPIDGGENIGVVLMHGKGGTTRWVDPLASSLRSAGIRVVTPNMPWHKNRIYDRGFEDSMLEIHGHVQQLQADGAEKIYVAGHSLGAVATAGYAARYDGIQGVMLLAPGHFVGLAGFNSNFLGDLRKANAMIKQGKGDRKSSFGDINGGKRATRQVTAEIYKSWFSATGPAEFVGNMAALKGGIPVLYIAGSRDRIPRTKDRSYAFDGAPGNPKSRFEVINAGHLEVPRMADEVVIEWLRGL